MKKIPQFMFLETEENISVFLDYYFKGDGWREHKRSAHTGQFSHYKKCLSKSKELTDGINTLMLKIGEIPTIRAKTIKKGRYAGNIYWGCNCTLSKVATVYNHKWFERIYVHSLLTSLLKYAGITSYDLGRAISPTGNKRRLRVGEQKGAISIITLQKIVAYFETILVDYPFKLRLKYLEDRRELRRKLLEGTIPEASFRKESLYILKRRTDNHALLMMPKTVKDAFLQRNAKKATLLLEILKSLITGDVYFDAIESAEIVTLEEPVAVYDITITPKHTFLLANGLFVHNTFLLSGIMSYSILNKQELIFSPLGDKSNSFTTACLPLFNYDERTKRLLHNLTEKLGVEPAGIPLLTLTVLQEGDKITDNDKNPPTIFDRVVMIKDPKSFEIDFKEVVNELKGIAETYGYAKTTGLITVRNLDRYYTGKNVNIDVQNAISLLQQFDAFRKSNLRQYSRVFIDEISYLASAQVTLYGSDALRSGATISDYIKESRRNKSSVDMASLQYSEPIIIAQQDRLKRVKIGEFIDNLIDRSDRVIRENNAEFIIGDGTILASAFDPSSLNGGMFPVTAFVRHLPKKKLCEVVLEHGKKVRVTTDESLFTLNAKNEVSPVMVDNLGVGEYVACPSKICFNSALPSEINAIEIALKTLSDEDLGKVFLRPDGFRKIIRQEFDLEHSKKLCGLKIDQRHRLSLLSIKRIGKGLPASLIKKYNAKVGTAGSNTPVNPVVPLSNDFFWLLGLIIADGSMSNHTIEITCGVHETEYLNRANEIIQRIFGIRGNTYPEYRGQKSLRLLVSSSGLIWTLKLLGITAAEKGRGKFKNIPEIVLNAPEEQIKAFLQGFWAGDGSKVISRPKIQLTTSRLSIADDLVHLFLRIGLPACMSKTKDMGYSKKPNYIVLIEGTTIETFKKPVSEKELVPCYSLCYEIIQKLRVKGAISSFYMPALKQQHPELSAFYRSSIAWKNRSKTPSRKKLEKLLSVIQDPRYSAIVEEENAALNKLLAADIQWLKVKAITEVTDENCVYDIEVKIDDRQINNFIAGTGGVFCHNTQLPLEVLPEIRNSATNVFFRDLAMSKDKNRSQIDFLLDSIRLKEPAIRPVIKAINERGLLPKGYWFWYRAETRDINVINPCHPKSPRATITASVSVRIALIFL